jgi:5-methyltetrahydrofolate--homocysteine methyltransferase
MLIVGELINASRKRMRQAIGEADAAYVAQVAADQARAGADYIDVNAGTFVEREAELLPWLVETVQAEAGAPCCLDSPSPRAVRDALAVHRGQALVNSISLEAERWQELMPVVAGSGCRIVALCMSDQGMPETADQRLAIADKLIEGLTKEGFALEDIFVDPLVQPVATNVAYGPEFLQAVERIMAGWPGVHTICGLSNISYGLPARKVLNHTFLAMAVGRGLDAAIINPLDQRLVAMLRAAEALAGRDAFCGGYLQAYRAGLLEG